MITAIEKRRSGSIQMIPLLMARGTYIIAASRIVSPWKTMPIRIPTRIVIAVIAI
jgi:hypothetical protein